MEKKESFTLRLVDRPGKPGIAGVSVVKLHPDFRSIVEAVEAYGSENDKLHIGRWFFHRYKRTDYCQAIRAERVSRLGDTDRDALLRASIFYQFDDGVDSSITGAFSGFAPSDGTDFVKAIKNVHAKASTYFSEIGDLNELLFKLGLAGK